MEELKTKDTNRAVGKARIRLCYLFKQLLPFKYTSRYRDATGNKYIATWRQWFGHVFNYKICVIEP